MSVDWKVEAEYQRTLMANLREGYITDVCALRKQLSEARAKSARQRKELRRLNAQLRWIYRGIAASERVVNMAALRTALAEKFGRPAVHDAEREYLAKQQEQDR